jgi:hypothetical protein
MGLFAFSRSACTKGFGRVLGVMVVVISVFAAAPADVPSPDLAKVFPAELGGFHQIEQARQIIPGGKEIFQPNPKQLLPIFVAATDYASPDGENIRIGLTKVDNDSAAYSILTGWRKYQRDRGQVAPLQVNDIGTASTLISSQSLAFFKGSAFVTVDSANARNSDQITTIARLFAATLDNGEGDIPVLVKHLPNWEQAQPGALYAVNSETLLVAVPNQPILKEVSFEGGTEAVIANYGQSQMVIVEYTTPQFSVENDQRIWTRIAELKSQGQPVPIAYRRVGNYSVFVFNAPDEKTANALVDQVRYEQIVQWLGDDPHMADRLQRYFSRTTSGVLIAVLKSSGLSLLICLGAGGLFGALLFRHRRAQHAALYSDAGGGTRLNLDELTGANKSQRLLGRGEQPESDS